MFAILRRALMSLQHLIGGLLRDANSPAGRHDLALYGGTFLSLYLPNVASPTVSALIAAVPPTISQAVRYFWDQLAARRSGKQLAAAAARARAAQYAPDGGNLPKPGNPSTSGSGQS